jgi:methylmalonyl-CoA/ethylmalonyl-CoA epimerase
MFDRIHHAGLAVSDLDAARRVFADGLGLIVDPLPSMRRAQGGNNPTGRQQGADPTEITDIPIGNSELELNAPVTEGGVVGGTARFLQQRGVTAALHHVCMHSTNVPEDIAHLRASGLRPIAASPEQLASDEPWRGVAFFHPRDCAGVLLEIWPTDNHRVGDRNQGEGVFTRLDHIGVVTRDLEEARRFWCNMIGLRVDVLRSPVLKGGRVVEAEQTRVLNIPAGPDGSEIEAIQPLAPDTAVARFLAKHGGSAGGAMHHVALAAPDVRLAVDYVRERGLRPIPGAADADVAWIHPASTGGVLIQVVRDERARA